MLHGSHLKISIVLAGIGMTGLPIRFMRPPRIDIIHLYD